MSHLLSCYNDWSLSRNSLKVCDVMFLDLSTAVSKAFDSVPMLFVTVLVTFKVKYCIVLYCISMIIFRR